MWPGPDYPALPPAPFNDGHPRRPRQVRAGVPAVLDDVTCQAMQVPGRDGTVLSTPGQLAGALAAELPPEEVPPAPQAGPATQAPSRHSADTDYWQDNRAPATRPEQWRPPRRQQGGRQQGGRQQSGGARTRVAVVGALVLIVVIGVVAATSPFWHKNSASHHTSGPAHPRARQTTQAVALTPVSASGFDADNPNNDPGNENTNQAMNILQGNKEGWSSQEYDSADLGRLKPGTGLIFDMGRSVRLSSVTVKFGPNPGADVHLLLGDSNERSQSNEESMTPVASQDE
jgi:hypothetical protein